MNSLRQLIKPRSRHTLPAIIIAIVCFIVAVATGYYTYQQHQTLSQIQTRIQRLQELQAKSNKPAPNPLNQDEQKHWTALQKERQFNWDALFAAIEQTASHDIELLELEPDKANQRVLLRGEAKNSPALTNYLASLTAQSQLQQVHLLHQQRVVHDRLETIAFEIKARVVP